jgi:SAM-dependent methyltransferase
VLANHLRCPSGDYGVDLAEKMNEGNLYINQYTIEALNLSTNQKCLEVGMGNGRFIESIFELYGESIFYYGLDHSRDMVQEATVLNTDRVSKGNVALKEGRVEDMPFLGDQFDVVFSINTLYFWSDVGLTLQGIKNVLLSKGRLMLAIRPKSLMETYPMVKHGFRMFEVKEIKSLLSDAGFQNIIVESKEEPPQEVYGQILSKSALLISAVKP